jgi:hypothetical protein
MLNHTLWRYCGLLILSIGFITNWSKPLAMGQTLGDLLDADTPTAKEAARDDEQREVGESTKTETPAGSPKLRTPSVPEQKAALQTIEDLFRSEISAASDSQSKALLAEKFRRFAADTNSPSEKYALLSAAISMATDGGDADVAMKILDEMGETFAVAVRPQREAILISMSKTASVDQLDAICKLLIAEADSRLLQQQFDDAETLAKAAAVAARKARVQELQKSATDTIAAIRDKKKEYNQLQPFVERITANPRDGEAATKVGVHLCLDQNDWAQGLEILRFSDNRPLALLALAEEKSHDRGDSNSKAALELADAWMTFAEVSPKGERIGWLGRAEHHYLNALNNLSGLEELRVKKRLEEIAALRIAVGGAAAAFPPGLIMHLDAANFRTINSGLSSTAREPSPVSRWRCSVSPLAASVVEGSQPPLWSPKAAGGKPGLVFRGRSKMVVPTRMPSSGTLITVATPAVIANQRAISGPVRILFRDDAAMWMEYKTDQGTTAIRGPRQIYEPEKGVMAIASWKKPFSLSIVGAQSVSESAAEPSGTLVDEPLLLGGGTRGTTESFKGVLSNLLLFERVLSPAELEKTIRCLK